MTHHTYTVTIDKEADGWRVTLDDGQVMPVLPLDAVCRLYVSLWKGLAVLQASGGGEIDSELREAFDAT